jgi:outer membrane protein assembly factor BamB
MKAIIANVLMISARRLAAISAVFTCALLGNFSASVVNAATIVAHFDTASYGAIDAEGLAFDGSFLWLLNDVGADQRVYRVDPVSGAGTFAFIAPGDDPEGIAFDGTNLRISGGNGLIYTVDRITGAVLGSVPVPTFQIDGLAFGAGRLYASSTSPEIVYELDATTGAVTAQFATAGGDGLEYIAGSPNLLLLGDVGSDRISITRASDLAVLEVLNLTELAEAAGIAGADNPYGLAYDGQFVWYVDHTRQLLVKLDVDLPSGTVPEPGGLALVSLGLTVLLVCWRHRSQRAAQSRTATAG